jgi:hypothetical protein
MAKVKLMNGQLQGTIDALADISANRVSGTKAWEISDLKGAFAEKFAVFQGAKDPLVAAHEPEEGKGLKLGGPNWDEFWVAYSELADIEVEVEITPLDKTFVLSLDEVKSDSIGILRLLGIVIEKNPKPGRKAKK